MTIQWKQFSDSSYDCVAYDLVKNRLSESQAEAEEQNQSFPFCFLSSPDKTANNARSHH